MIIEAQLESKMVQQLGTVLGNDVQIVGSRLQQKVEDAGKRTVVAVASGFRTHDAFSLTLINVPIAISIVTRIEGDLQSSAHNQTVEKIVGMLVNWHKYGDDMGGVFSTPDFLAGELRMDGGTTQTKDKDNKTWNDVLNINIRGSEKLKDKHHTFITFDDGTEGEYNWVGAIGLNTMEQVGLFDENTGYWLRLPKDISIGTSVTSLGRQCFINCYSLRNTVVPTSVTSIGEQAFIDTGLESATFTGRTMAQVQAMANYPWDVPRNAVIHCLDGDITPTDE